MQVLLRRMEEHQIKRKHFISVNMDKKCFSYNDAGYVRGKLYSNDGRSKSNENKYLFIHESMLKDQNVDYIWNGH